ncbi:MAG: Metallopeptidase-like protein [Candidatus Woesebacteria bacterium GW2011_GWB1_43_14]|uniref:Metallopeptidase-like protein n=1 Tax=Candidatus Woesebacteria bacterium GW2011_GWB1_43_14 TaxID=1618578 RepID=A0A0G1DHS1_9BACT|nr:MAG: Metallopeptidase-like protein [Candidatus Woesebacteria bacterium GW2011_GWA1_39_11b]KKS78477.1 MAG: Metallopeptidase-like protein [Candidatus Woesebacteria bacterium GW2011_GWC1_42_9]KKS97107.1 MAG: Metallopeptidase-like protein [Candidatus Woesebacteria bacterium GW2011_GWB1_43_14]
MGLKQRRKSKKALRFSKSLKLTWEDAHDISERLKKIVLAVEMDWVDPSRVYCYRSNNSKARAYARIWGFSRIWQQALDKPPLYIIEVLAEKFDNLSDEKKDYVLLHELAHIPKNFSGALVPHTRRGKNNFHDKLKKMANTYKSIKK